MSTYHGQAFCQRLHVLKSPGMERVSSLIYRWGNCALSPTPPGGTKHSPPGTTDISTLLKLSGRIGSYTRTYMEGSSMGWE